MIRSTAVQSLWVGVSTLLAKIPTAEQISGLEVLARYNREPIALRYLLLFGSNGDSLGDLTMNTP